MKRNDVFLIAGGGTGGHVIPALAVARELRARGHEAFFVGTRQGMEARLVPPAGFPMEWVEVGGLKGVSAQRRLQTLAALPLGIGKVLGYIRARKPVAVFSMGGFVAGPVVLAALLRRLPVVVMEANAVPGFTNRWISRLVARALISFPETARFFPKGRTEITGLPVRPEFFSLPPKRRAEKLAVLITGGSRGSRTLNRASRESWKLFQEAGFPVRILHQSGASEFAEMKQAFAVSGMEGEVRDFIDDMPAAFASADLIVCRSGAGAVSELAAAGKAAILVPFPYATDQHQLRNAEVLARAGAARLVLDSQMTGEKLFGEVTAL
ncbi:MAG: undecaprenyldiphospho-muramoylpentapeptide beta-N-acetylglucosaminyltransferase, partial [Acidobacteria bacterium]|nr:undecaprenyldiphospho-muramoylpentapeptide beta-N-acetylglucosaminyltransferase [Acidobacteriota bacterium]